MRRASPLIRPERLIGRNSGPLVIPEAASHVLHGRDRLEVPSVRDGDFLALALLVGLGPADQHAEPVGDLNQVLDVERGKLGAAEGAGKAERQDGAVALAGQRLRGMRQHGGDDLDGRGRLAAGGDADAAADAAHGRLDMRALGRVGLAGELVGVADRGEAAADGAGFGAALGLGDEELRHRLGARRHGLAALGAAPGVKGDGVARVGPHGRIGLLGPLKGADGSADQGRELGFGLDEGGRGRHLAKLPGRTLIGSLRQA